jgi:hypothetical protein
MSSGQIEWVDQASSRYSALGHTELDFGASFDVLTLKRGTTDPRYFQAQTTAFVNFPWLPEAEEMRNVFGLRNRKRPLPETVLIVNIRKFHTLKKGCRGGVCEEKATLNFHE